MKVKADLFLSITPELLRYVKNCGTALEVWKKLEETFRSKGPAKATNLMKVLTRKATEHEDMEKYIDTYYITVDSLAQMDIVLDDKLITVLLLNNLPDSFNNLKCAIEARDELPL